LLEVLIGVRFAPDTTLRYQKSAVNSTGKNQLSHGHITADSKDIVYFTSEKVIIHFTGPCHTFLISGR
jgi:hypothetical protein